MKRILLFLSVLSLLAGCVVPGRIEKEEQRPELRGVWFSFYDWKMLGNDEETFRSAVEEVCRTVEELGLTAIFLHVHSHSDSYYCKTSYFPYSSRAPQSADPAYGQGDFDPLSVFIESAHNHGLELHAWLNPYRIGSEAQLYAAPEDSCIGKWRKEYEQSLIEKELEKSDAGKDEKKSQEHGTSGEVGPQSDSEKKTTPDGTACIEITSPDGELIDVIELTAEGVPVTQTDDGPEGTAEPPAGPEIYPESAQSEPQEGTAVTQESTQVNLPEDDREPPVHIPCPILCHKGVYYLNPASTEIQNTFVLAVKELCENYAIDGLHFDDYFYPLLNDANPELSFDKEDWEKSGSEKSLTHWRRDNVSALVQAVHDTAHAYSLPFGISPTGNLRNLASPRQYLVDIKKWVSSDKYVDYIMPQLYWGFETRAANGELRPWAFDNCLDEWTSLMGRSNVTLYVGLALYKTGLDNPDGNEVSEWLRYEDIIVRQIQRTRENRCAQGFVLFDYKDILAREHQNEVHNIRELLKETHEKREPPKNR